MALESFVKSGFASQGATELLAAPVDALNGTTAAQAAALREVLGMASVFDLAACQLLHGLRQERRSSSFAGDMALGHARA